MKNNNYVICWININLIAIFFMILIGGITRLTDAGLSMTSWKPLTGILPPINNDDWEISFNEYKKYPEYQNYLGLDQINDYNSRYMNSGVYIGKTFFIKELIAKAMEYAIPHGVTMNDYREYLESKPEDYPKGSQDQDIFRYMEPDFYPRLRVDYNNQMANRS